MNTTMFRMKRSQGTARKTTKPSLVELERRDVPAGWLATAADAGGGPHVIIRTDTNNDGKPDTTSSSFFAFDPNFRGGVRVATGDFNGDGHDELVTAAGAGGGPHIKIWNVDAQGQLLSLRDEFFAFEASFRGGSWIASGDFNVDGKDELVVGAGEGGGPKVQIFSDTNNDGRVADALVDSFYPFTTSFRGGVRVAVGQFTGGVDMLVVAAGPGGGPHVKIFWNSGLPVNDLKVSNDEVINEFYAADASYRGGVFVATADVGSDPRTELFVTTGRTVKVIDKHHMFGPPLPGSIGFASELVHFELDSFDIGGSQFHGDAHVAVSNFVPGDGRYDLVTSLGSGAGTTGQISIWSGDSGTGVVSALPRDDEFFSFMDPSGTPYGVGVFVAFGV